MPTELPQTTIILTYIAILLGVLALAGAVLATLTFVFHRDVRRVWTTYGSWWVLGPVAFGAIYLGRVPTILLFTVFALLALNEFARATQLRRDRCMTAAAILAILAASALTIAFPARYALYASLPGFAAGLFALIPILRNRTDGQLQMMSASLLGFMTIGWLFLHVGWLANVPNGAGYLLYLLLAVELNDVAAFTFGTLLGRKGRHLLRSNISPKKTWEGAVGALAISMALPWLLRFSLPRFGTASLLLAGLIVGVAGQIGDLAISVIKRDAGVKDMGSLIPGHGGMLDRIDSLIFATPLFLLLIRALDHG